MIGFGIAGTPQFAADIGERLIVNGHRPRFILTRSDKPRDRGKRVQPSVLKKLALAHSIPCIETETLDEDHLKTINEYAPDLLIVIAFGLLLPERLLSLPPLGCINIHTSLLPRWRGAAPVIRSIEAGDEHSGITLMRMTPSLDAGPILVQKRCPIHTGETAAIVEAKLTELAVAALLGFLAAPGQYKGRIQDEDRACYAAKVTKEEARIKWDTSSSILARRVCAFNPKPGCYTFYRNRRLKIWQAHSLEKSHSSPPGSIVGHDEDSFQIATGDGLLVVTQLQFAGEKKQSATEAALVTGEVLG